MTLHIYSHYLQIKNKTKVNKYTEQRFKETTLTSVSGQIINKTM